MVTRSGTSTYISTRSIRSRRCCRGTWSTAPRCAQWRSSSPATSIRSTIVAPLRYLKNELGQEQAKIDAWYHHWVVAGFDAIEAMVHPGPYRFGTEVTLADICLVPQVANARRLKVPLESFRRSSPSTPPAPKLPAFEKARPENQPDAE